MPVTLSSATHGSGHGPPALPVAGKVIQPVPKGVVAALGREREKEDANGSGRPVWGAVRPGQGAGGGGTWRAQNDFPTAAEAAQSTSRSLFFSTTR